MPDSPPPRQFLLTQNRVGHCVNHRRHRPKHCRTCIFGNFHEAVTLRSALVCTHKNKTLNVFYAIIFFLLKVSLVLIVMHSGSRGKETKENANLNVFRKLWFLKKSLSKMLWMCWPWGRIVEAKAEATICVCLSTINIKWPKFGWFCPFIKWGLLKSLNLWLWDFGSQGLLYSKF